MKRPKFSGFSVNNYRRLPVRQVLVPFFTEYGFTLSNIYTAPVRLALQVRWPGVFPLSVLKLLGGMKSLSGPFWSETVVDYNLYGLKLGRAFNETSVRE